MDRVRGRVDAALVGEELAKSILPSIDLVHLGVKSNGAEDFAILTKSECSYKRFYISSLEIDLSRPKDDVLEAVEDSEIFQNFRRIRWNLDSSADLSLVLLSDEC